MSTSASAPSQEQIETAVERTLVGWGAELDVGQKFWWMDWNRMIRDVITTRCAPANRSSTTTTEGAQSG